MSMRLKLFPPSSVSSTLPRSPTMNARVGLVGAEVAQFRDVEEFVVDDRRAQYVLVGDQHAARDLGRRVADQEVLIQHGFHERLDLR